MSRGFDYSGGSRNIEVSTAPDPETEVVVNRTLRTLVVYGLSIILLAVLAQWWFDQVSGPEEVSLSEFVTSVEAGEFAEVQILARSNQVQGRTEAGTGARLRLGGRGQLPGRFEGDLTTSDPGIGGRLTAPTPNRPRSGSF